MPRNRNGGLRKVCGCPRRVWAKCPHPWHFNYKPRDPSRHNADSNDGGYRFSLDRHLNRRITDKTEAEREAARIRIAIDEGKFGQAAPRTELTLRQLVDVYLERYVRVKRAATERSFKYELGRPCRTVLPRPTGGSAPLGDWRLTDIVTDTIERLRQVLRQEGSGLVAINRYLSAMRALCNWAVRVGYMPETPFRRGSQTVVSIEKKDEPKRSRRLNPDTDEEARLLAACGDRLRSVVECALESGMRRGEILSLQWSQVQGMKVEDDRVIWAPKATLYLPAEKTKTKSDRWIPISTRLNAILEMRRFNPAGQPMPPTAYVFGNAIGQRVKDIKRAWNTAVLKAHGHEPSYTKTANLSAESRRVYEAIDLHFHDLRREAGSRWLEGGVPIHTVRDWLGHANVSQTSTYLAGTVRTQHDAMRRFEEHQAALQRIATRSGTGGRKGPRLAVSREGNPKKTAVRREPAPM
jgi:integrase